MAHHLTARITLLATAGMLAVASAAPGNVFHNCRTMGTRTATPCGCCEDDASMSARAGKGCCAQSAEAATEIDASIGSTCCFVSIDEPFSYSGQMVAPSNAGQDLAMQSGLDCPVPATHDSVIAPKIVRVTGFDLSRHAPDPPLFLSHHSFRC